MKVCAFFPLAALALAGCDTTSATGNFTGTPAIRIAGSWTYRFDVIEPSMMATCHLTRGTMTINQTQNGDQFTGGVSGDYACINGGEAPEPATAIVPVTVGELAGQGVRFIAFGCIHLGALTGSDANHFAGTLNCTFPLTEMGPAYPFSGTWEATRR